MADGVDLEQVTKVYRDCIEAGRGLTQDMINWRGVIQNDGQLGNAAAADTVSEIAMGNAATVRANLGFVGAALTEMQKYGLGITALPTTWPLSSLDDDPTNVPSGMYRSTSVFTYQATVIWLTYNSGVGSMLLIEVTNSKSVVRSRGYGSTGWGAWRRMLDSENTTVDSNGFIKAASPIFRLCGDPSTAVGYGFTADGCGAYNSEAEGVTASHNDVGVYTVSGSLGFAEDGWTIEIPQDVNGNRLCFVETETADDGTITVRTFGRRFDYETAMIVAGDPIDIPDGRWIDLRLSMPQPEQPQLESSATEETQ